MKTSVIKLLIAVSWLLLAGSFFAVKAQRPGTLDTTFGNAGKVLTDMGDYYYTIYAMVLQPDGKIVVTGEDYCQCFQLARYNKNGTLDSSFGTAGKARSAIGNGIAIALQSDDKIVAGGSYFDLTRFNKDGSLDSAFGCKGIAKTDFGTEDRGSSIAIQPDGNIIIAGNVYISSGPSYWQLSMARYKINGVLDSSFGNNGRAIYDYGDNVGIGRIVLQKDNKIVLAGLIGQNDFALFRYNSNGSIDSTFGSNGSVVFSYGTYVSEWSSLAIQKDDKIITIGQADKNYATARRDFVLARFNTNGSMDNTFGSMGIASVDFGWDDCGSSVVLQTDGKIIAAGCADNTGSGCCIGNFALTRLNSDGSIDSTFGIGGKIITDFGGTETVSTAAIQPDGKIILAGGSAISNSKTEYALARYFGDKPSDINELMKNELLKVYPNPASDFITINLNSNLKSHISYLISIKNLQGQEVLKQRTAHNAQSTVNVSGLSNGLYFITLQNEKVIYVSKFVINH